ncbi:MAG: pilus motility taxis protein HmpF [Cyanobacterium sp.]
MLYLAEVKAQTRGFVGGYKTELKLLTSQAMDQTWTAITGEDTINIDAISEQTSKGTLYIVNLDNNKQIQGSPELAGSRIVNYLRHFSRTLEKSKSQEEEIEEWKVSLQIQGEEIAKRQAELDGQQQRLQEQESKLALLEEEKNKLTAAWEQLTNEQQRLNNNKIDQGEIREKLESISGAIKNNIPQPQMFTQPIEEIVSGVNNQQAKLDEYWRELEHNKSSLEQQQNELNNQKENFNQRQEELLMARENLAKAKLTLQNINSQLQEKQSLLRQFSLTKEGIHRLQQEIYLLGDDGEEQQVDLQTLETMPLGDLEAKVNEVKEETAKVVNFVNMQEEELTLQSDEVKDIQHKMNNASEVDKLSLETELADAQEAMKLLNETLVGQRRNLKKQQKVLNEYLKVFSRRKGIIDLDFAETINVKPLLAEVEAQKLEIDQKIEHFTNELNQLQQAQKQEQETINFQEQNYQQAESQLHSNQENVENLCRHTTEIQAKINLLEQALHPIQEQLNHIRNNAQKLQSDVGEIHTKVEAQNDAMNELQSMLN